MSWTRLRYCWRTLYIYIFIFISMHHWIVWLSPKAPLGPWLTEYRRVINRKIGECGIRNPGFWGESRKPRVVWKIWLWGNRKPRFGWASSIISISQKPILVSKVSSTWNNSKLKIRNSDGKSFSYYLRLRLPSPGAAYDRLHIKACCQQLWGWQSTKLQSLGDGKISQGDGKMSQGEGKLSYRRW